MIIIVNHGFAQVAKKGVVIQLGPQRVCTANLIQRSLRIGLKSYVSRVLMGLRVGTGCNTEAIEKGNGEAHTALGR